MKHLLIILLTIAISATATAQDSSQIHLEKASTSLSASGKAFIASFVSTTVGVGGGVGILVAGDGQINKQMGITLTTLGGTAGIISFIFAAGNLISAGKQLDQIDLTARRETRLTISSTRTGIGMRLQF